MASSMERKFTKAYMRPGKVTTSSSSPNASKASLRAARVSRGCRLPSQRCLLGPLASSAGSCRWMQAFMLAIAGHKSGISICGS